MKHSSLQKKMISEASFVGTAWEFKFVVNAKQVLVAKSNDVSWCKLKEVLEYKMRDAL